MALQPAIEASSAAPYLVDLSAKKAEGRAYLNANRYDEALQTYARILRDHPDDVESYLFMGDCYLADGDANTALLLYSQALLHAPQDEEVRKKIRVARRECLQAWNVDAGLERVDVLREETIPSNPETVAAMVQKMAETANPVGEEDILRAAALLDEIIHSAHPARLVAGRLQEIDALVPALLKLNIRQAQADGRPDVAHLLEQLLENILTQMDLQQSDQLRPVPDPERSEGVDPAEFLIGDAQHPRRLHILVIDPIEGEPSEAVWMALNVLAKAHCEAEVASRLSPESLGQFDVAIAYRPHCHPTTMETLVACAAAKVPILLYMDADYEKMPLDHPDYEPAGLWSPARAKAFSMALLLANTICVPSQSMADSLRSLGYRASVIPDGWPPEIHENGKSEAAQSRRTLNLGWIGEPGHVEDVAQVRRMILRVMREFPVVNLVISGDPQVYQLFDSIPESRRLYAPVVNAAEGHQHLLEQVDILMVPLRNTPFNNSLSDRRLVEAGSYGIPWVASPIPAHLNWKAGGLVANTLDEWHTHLRQLILDQDLRSLLSWTGHELATASRTPSSLGSLWIEAINDAMKVEDLHDLRRDRVK